MDEVTIGWRPYLPLLHAAAVAFGLLVYVLTARQETLRRPPGSAVAWVLSIVAMPYAAVPAFLVFGHRKRRRRFVALPTVPATAPAGPPWLRTLGVSLGLPPGRDCTSAALYDNGSEAFAALIATVHAARRQLDVELFILRPDNAGLRFVDALLARASEGVRVRVLLDYVGNVRHTLRLARLLNHPGIALRFFGRPLGLRSLVDGNLRDHRKLVIADGESLWAGGRNVADEYFDASGHGWLDVSYTVAGGTAADAQALFDREWGDAPSPASTTPLRSAVPGARRHSAQFLPSGPDFAVDPAYDVLLTAIHQARHRIWAATPYFVPNDTFLHALCLAARRGVDVRLLLPAASNHRLADIARRFPLRSLAACGGSVLLGARMNHAKVLLFDDAIASCGSLNLDGRSLFVNYEASMLFYGEDEIRWVAQWFEHLLPHAVRARTRPAGIVEDLLEGAVRAFAFQL